MSPFPAIAIDWMFEELLQRLPSNVLRTPCTWVVGSGRILNRAIFDWLELAPESAATTCHVLSINRLVMGPGLVTPSLSVPTTTELAGMGAGRTTTTFPPVFPRKTSPASQSCAC